MQIKWNDEFSKDMLDHVHEQGKSWCAWLLEPMYTQEEKDDMLKELAATWRTKIFTKGHKRLSLAAIRDMVAHVDRLWFKGHLIPGLIDAYGDVVFKIDNQRVSIAAYVLEYKDKIELCFNQTLFCDTFRRKEKGYHAGGLLCQSRFDCFMHILLHEICHLALSLCDRWNYWDDRNPHGPMFLKIVNNFYGQTDPNHGIIPGFSQSLSLIDIKKKARVGKKVHVFATDDNGNQRWLPGKLMKKMPKEATVLMNGQEYDVNYGLICISDC